MNSTGAHPAMFHFPYAFLRLLFSQGNSNVLKRANSEGFALVIQLTLVLGKAHAPKAVARFLPHLIFQGTQSLLHQTRPLHPIHVQQICQHINSGGMVQRKTTLGATAGTQQPMLCGCLHLQKTDSHEHPCMHNKEGSNSSNPKSFLPRTGRPSLSEEHWYLCAMSRIFCSVFCFS